MEKILVTGGCGYIGSHTIVDLIENGYEVISIDNNSRSSDKVLNAIFKITNVHVKNYKVNLCDYEETVAVFHENDDIAGIIHFAAYKAVGESVENPLMYYDNNINSLLNILRCADEFSVSNFVFSSSCTVYGNPHESPVTEETVLQNATSPYGATKQFGEIIINDLIKSTTGLKACLLRYFNPVGAHPSNEIGETPVGKPQNLLPAITQAAIGLLPELKVWGNDYDTKDGTCIRDFIHVCDIAHAHTLAINFLKSKTDDSSAEIFNLGSGKGYSILEVINTFEKENKIKLNYCFAERRKGDVVSIFANNSKATQLLKWKIKYNLNAMVKTAWEWENK
jgi:UDP-glucose 4-epimerase